MDSSILRCKRINMGAHEAFILVCVYFCYRSKHFLQRPRRFLACKGKRNTLRSYIDPRIFLHLQRSYRKVSWLCKYIHFLYFCGDFLHLWDKTLQWKEASLQIKKSSYNYTLRHFSTIYYIYLLYTSTRNFQRSCNRNVWNIKTSLWYVFTIGFSYFIVL